MSKIMIIDDGVQCKNAFFDSGLFADIIVDEELRVRPRSKTEIAALDFSHGTICAAIIKKYTPHASLGSIHLLPDKKNLVSQEQLLTALVYLTETNVDIIHMSIGTTCLTKFLDFGSITHKLQMQGKTLVAAVDNDGKYCLPACLSSVIGVQAISCSESSILVNPIPKDGVDLLCSGQHVLLDRDGNSFCPKSSNSFAAPVVTAAFARDAPVVQNYNSQVKSYYPSLDFSFLLNSSFPILFPSVYNESFPPCDDASVELWDEARYQNWIDREFEFLYRQTSIDHFTNANSLWIGYSSIDSLMNIAQLVEKAIHFLQQKDISVVGYSDIAHLGYFHWHPIPSCASIHDVVLTASYKYDVDCLIFVTNRKHNGNCCDFCILENDVSSMSINKEQYIINTPFGEHVFDNILPLLQTWIDF